MLAQAGDLCNLGLAQKRAGMWLASLASYDQCLVLIAEALEAAEERAQARAAKKQQQQQQQQQRRRGSKRARDTEPPVTSSGASAFLTAATVRIVTHSGHCTRTAGQTQTMRTCAKRLAAAR
eukprot:COSAG01_NODE_2180_length_8215_cov_3.853006_12_plen_122_part_00